MDQFLKRAPRYFKRRFARGALILVYHRVSDSRLDPWSLSVSPGHFAEHLAVLRRSFHPVSLQDVGRSIQNQENIIDRSIVLTFDDGYADNLYTALPLLERFAIPATIFITTGAIGAARDFWWDELAALLLTAHSLPERLEITIDGQNYSWDIQAASRTDEFEYSNWRAGQTPPTARHSLYLQLWKLIHGLSVEGQQEVLSTLRAWAGTSSSGPMYRILDETEVGKLARSATIEIGAHTVHHVSLASLACEAQRGEISGSKAHLENIVNRPVKSFSYPFGKQQDYQPQTIALVQEAGFSVACSNESGVVSAKADPFQLPRVHIHDCSGDEFEARLLSKYHGN